MMAQHWKPALQGGCQQPFFNKQAHPDRVSVLHFAGPAPQGSDGDLQPRARSPAALPRAACPGAIRRRAALEAVASCRGAGKAEASPNNQKGYDCCTAVRACCRQRCHQQTPRCGDAMFSACMRHRHLPCIFAGGCSLAIKGQPAANSAAWGLHCQVLHLHQLTCLEHAEGTCTSAPTLCVPRCHV